MKRRSAACRDHLAITALVATVIGTWSPPASAYAQVAERAFALDAPLSSTDPEGYTSTTPLFATATAIAVAGKSSAYAYTQADGLGGAIHDHIRAAVSADTYLVGRDSNATGTGVLTGSIQLSSTPLPTGLATFTMAIDGGYTFDNSTVNINNAASLSYSVLIGTVGYSATVDFDANTHGGLVDIPLTFTMPVTPGETIDMSFYLTSSATAVAGTVDLDLLNTMKLTSISLPAGYTYSPGSDGFLSQFAAPVPEPGMAALDASGLVLLLAAVRRRRSPPVAQPATAP